MSVLADPVAVAVHPLVQAGGWAVAVMAGRADPREVTEADVGAVAGQITADALVAARAAPGRPGYAWWKSLYALVPNSPPTHPRRAGWPDLRDRIAALFVADEDAEGPAAVCVMCGRHGAAAWWGRSLLPTVEATGMRNCRRGADADPVCRACRVSVWALPYGAHMSTASALVVTTTGPGGPEVARAWARQQRARARDLLTLPDAPGRHDPAFQDLAVLVRRATAEVAVEVTAIRNDNRQPWVRMWQMTRSTTGFLRALRDGPAAADGWATLVEQRGDDAVLAVCERPGAVDYSPTRAVADEVDRHIHNARRLGQADSLRTMTAMLLLWVEHTHGPAAADLVARAAALVREYGRPQFPRPRGGLRDTLERQLAASLMRAFTAGRPPALGVGDLVALHDTPGLAEVLAVLVRHQSGAAMLPVERSWP